MGVADYILLAIVGAAFAAAVRFLKKNGTGCGGCKGDCTECEKQKRK